MIIYNKSLIEFGQFQNVSSYALDKFQLDIELNRTIMIRPKVQKSLLSLIQTITLLCIMHTWCYCVFLKVEPVQEISNNVVCATSKASDQPAHTRSLIRAFASRLSIL